MNLGQIETALKDIFDQPLADGEQRKLVFWVDKDKEFIGDVNQFSIDGVRIHVLTERNQFSTKYLLEEEDPTSSYLIYTNLEMKSEDNWLMDTVLYSKTFYADRVSLILNELQMDSSLRTIVKKYEKFFDHKERFRKFQAYNLSSYSEEIIELAIMSVLCHVRTPDFESVLKSVLMDSLDDNDNKYLASFGKYSLLDAFWHFVSTRYGYDRQEKSLKTLFIHLTVTAWSHSVDEVYLANIKDYIATRNKANALVFVDRWMHHKSDYRTFDEYAEMIEKEIRVAAIVDAMTVDDCKQADTFPYMDRAIIVHIANGIATGLEDYEEYTKLIKLRRVKHYYERYASVYEALYYTVKMHEFYKAHRQGIPQGQAFDLYKAYVKEYHLMDTYYRKFYVAYDQESNNELLKKLKSLVENLYTNWYMGELSTHWSQAVHNEMKQQWSLPGILGQQAFYRSIVAPKISSGERVFVIISDAMRYEVAVELSERLNVETTGACDIQTLLGVVPSVTKLGMASLLPHRTLDIDPQGRVLVDGNDSAGLDNRKKIIENKVKDSIAMHAEDVMAMNRAGRREAFKDKKLIYLYHDTIDAMGDKASTEAYTFDAVERAISELFDLVRMIRDDLSATNIIITADHGFVYQRDPLEESDKIEKEGIPAIEVKRRYLLSHETGEKSGLLDINMDSIIQNEHRITTYVPKATIRFKMQGTGVNFVHGGASLQEIVVPLIQYKNIRSGQKNSREIEKVEIKLTSTTRKITNSLFNLAFFQTEKVEDKRIPRTVQIYMADDRDAVISNEETLICDRTFDKPEDRTYKLRFALKAIPYDKHKKYFLVIKDAETGVAVEKIPFEINLGIVSDFDF